MFSADFVIDGIVVFAIGLWPLLLVVAAAGVRWFNARGTAAATAVASVSTAHDTVGYRCASVGAAVAPLLQVGVRELTPRATDH